MYLAGKGQLPTNNSIPLQIVNVLGNFPAIETTKSYIHLLKTVLRKRATNFRSTFRKYDSAASG